MLDWSQCPAVERNPNKVSGAWVFKGTRVPVRALFENLQGGARVEDFLEWFPGVTREQVKAVLHHAEERLVAACPARSVSSAFSCPALIRVSLPRLLQELGFWASATPV